MLYQVNGVGIRVATGKLSTASRAGWTTIAIAYPDEVVWDYRALFWLLGMTSRQYVYVHGLGSSAYTEALALCYEIVIAHGSSGRASRHIIWRHRTP